MDEHSSIGGVKLADIFTELRLKMFGAASQQTTKYMDVSDADDDYNIAIRQLRDNLGDETSSDEEISKAYNGKELAYSQPLLSDFGTMTVNPGFKQKPSINNRYDLHKVLKKYSNNIILNAIILTRSNQASMFCQPARFSEKGLGFEIRLKDLREKPNTHDNKNIKRIEDFILNTGSNEDTNRDTFQEFVKKIIRDTLIYDQVNFEKVFDKNGKFVRFVAKDPSTIFFATDENGQIPKTGERFVQVVGDKLVAKFDSREMAFAVRNPRSDIYAAGYGYPELEVALKHFIAHENTETFNDRFFSHGGTTRGILLIKSAERQSQHALEIFKREWKNSLSGINGSWQIPVVSAEDVKFVNMTPSARDMEFEKWLNYLINVISSIYQIDPAEINFPNNGGATGSKGSSLNEGNSAQKMQSSQNKGLLPLLKFIESTINKHIVKEFGDKYVFQFIGGDSTEELKKIQILSEKGKIAMTVNEIREELGLEGDLPGGDIPLNGVVVQRLGQLIQLEQYEYQKQQDRLNRLMEHAGNTAAQPASTSDVPDGIKYQDVQQGLAGNSDSVNGKATHNKLVGKDGQSKQLENTNSSKQGGKGDN